MAPTKADLSELKNLAANLDERLKGGLHGEFFEEGSRLGDKHGREQLETLFELKAKIEAFLAGMQKQQRTEDDEDKNGKGFGKLNKNSIKAIKSVVEQEISDPLRTLSIEIQRLRDDVKAANARTEASEAKNRALEARAKKLETLQQKTERNVEGRFEVLDHKVNAANAAFAEFKESIKERVTALGDLVDSNVKIANDNDSNLRDNISKIEDQSNKNSQRVDRLETWKTSLVSWVNNNFIRRY